jgi:hypothetical protein
LIFTAATWREVRSHRLVERQQAEAAVVDVDVQAIDRLVAGKHRVEQLVIAGDQPFDRGAHAFFGEAAHLEQPPLERFELLWKCRTACSTSRISR